MKPNNVGRAQHKSFSLRSQAWAMPFTHMWYRKAESLNRSMLSQIPDVTFFHNYMYALIMASRKEKVAEN